MTTSLKPVLAVALAALALAACDDLTPPAKTDAGAGGPAVRSRAVGAVTETEVNASSNDAWIYFDFDKGGDLAVTDPLASADWDVAFQRFKVKSNGGISGAAGDEVAWLADTALGDVTRAPTTGWVVDRPDGDDENMDPDFGFNVGDGWYSYDPATHALAARKQTYVVMTQVGTFYAVQMLAYYDAAGTSGHLRLQWKRVDPPDGPRVPAIPWVPTDAGAEADGGGSDGGNDGGVEIDAAVEPSPDAAVDQAQAIPPVDSIEVSAGSAGTWVYLKAKGAPVVPADPATSTDWDLAFSRTLIRSNSGTSGSGMGGARLGEPDLGFDQIVAAPADGYEPDRLVPNAGPPGSGEHSGNPVLETWYDYDPVSHGTKPKAVVFVVRTASGGHAKLQVLSYEGGTYRLRLGILP